MQTIVGLYDNRTDADATVRDLIDYGIDRDDISMVTHSNDDSSSGAMSTSSSHSNDDSSSGTMSTSSSHSNQDVAAGAGEGAVAGAVVGGVGGALLSLAALAIPGIGPIVAAGPLVAGLVGSGIGAAAGGLIGALAEAGVPNDEASYYVEGVRRGGTLVSVEAMDDETHAIVDIMNRYNPVDLNQRVERWRSQGWTGDGADTSAYADGTERTFMDETDRTPATATTSARTDTQRNMESRTQSAQNKEVAIPVVEEELRVGKRQVEGGAVRVRSHMEEVPVEEQVRLRQENVQVERRPVNKPASATDIDAFKEQNFEMRTMSEEPVVEKQARVVEEVVVRKDAQERVETVHDTVRRTEVDVDRTATGEKQQGINNTSQNLSNWDDSIFRSHYQTTYSNRGRGYEEYEPAYRYGYALANDSRYENRNWSDIESDARTYWTQNHRGSAWDDFKDAVRTAWERTKATGRKGTA